MNDSVIYEREGAVAVVTLNRPERLNSFDAATTDALQRIFGELAEDASCRAVIVTGAGRGFCAGQDLTESAMTPGSPADVGDSLDTRFNPLVRLMRAMQKPIVVAVNGVAAGAGANFALQGDIVVAAKSAQFIQAFVKIGLAPDCGGSWSLTRLIGEARAKALAMLGEPISAQQAADWGLIWKAVDDADLMAEARALAARLAKAPPAALAAIKHLIHDAATTTMDEQLDLERDAQRALGYTEDFAEGVAAFREKRAPVFKGEG